MSQTTQGLSDAEKHPPSPVHSLHNSVSSSTSSSSYHQQQYDRPLQDSPTIGRVQNYPDSDPSFPTSPVTVTVGRHLRKPIPSPLHTTTAVSPPSSASPTKSDFPSAIHDQRRNQQYQHPGPITPVFPTSTSGPFQEEPRSSLAQKFTGVSYSTPTVPEEPEGDSEFDDSVTDSSPEQLHLPHKKAFGPRLSSLLPLQSSTNATRYSPEPSVTPKPRVGSPKNLASPMAGPPAAAIRMEGKGAPRNSSIDSAISAISTRTHSHKGSQDSIAASADVSHLINTAGSPEAVIQYLLREKQSQHTQNTQLWRLVDKQRAMILGLNKDLERALKDKEKYRKKLKDVITAQDTPGSSSNSTLTREGVPTIARVDVNGRMDAVATVPNSPNLDVDSAKESPIDVTMAPYPITPPADMVSGPPSAVGELLDPTHAMPKPAEHAYDKYDHEEEEREAQKEEEEKKVAMNKDIPFNLGLPPSRSLPSQPPRMPPPNPPTGPPEASPKMDGISQFPPPPAPPPRKPPPAPLRLNNAKPEPEEEDSDSDFDSLLEVTGLDLEKRGRRRTREEDDKERLVIALKEAEVRSLSKKSKGSKKGTPITEEAPVSPRTIPQALYTEPVTASLDGVLSGDNIRTQTLNAPAFPMSHGLPASPRPMGGVGSPMNSPPLSPRGMNAFTAPLSPRAPRAPIPLPPNTPLSTPSPAKDPSAFASPRPLNISTTMAMPTIIAPPGSPPAGESPTERTRIFKGLVTEEYPDLLLPPNALPSVDVRVASSRMKPSRASMLSLTQLEEDPVFTLAIFSRADRGELWRVEKDSISLAKLDQRLKQCPAFSAKTPDRSLFSGHSPAKLDARRLALDAYLAELLETPMDTATALEFCRYLSTNTLPPNSDETIPADTTSREITVQKTGPGGRPLRSGYLTKRGKNFGGWKARFFVLDGAQLKYFDGPGGPHLGTIKLLAAQIGKQSSPSDSNSSPARTGEDDNQYRHAFLILEPKKKDTSSHVKHVLCAESDRERDQWVDALLRWIDYRDPEEEERARKSGNAQDHEKATVRKKRPEKGRQLSDTSDPLIAMSYDATKQGDLPTREAAARPKTSSGPEAFSETMHSQAYNISAPRDPQVISDVGSWGGRTGGLQAPTTEEKKARKRSFFGFGPKTRSSSDSQDPLFDNGSSGGLVGASESRGVPRQVFGAPLGDAVRYNGPVDVKVPLPAVVFRCIQYLDAKGALSEEGIFRLSGSNVIIKQLKERFNTEGDVNLVTDETYYDIHAVASLLKLYLRELPATILTRDLHLQFLTVTEMRDHTEKIAALSELVERLPQANGTLLRYLIAFLIKIINNADKNKMTVRNVGIVFSPTLNIPAPVFAMFLQNYEGIFGIDPEQYELPSPVSDNDSHSQSRPSFDRPPPRPSTANGSGSPHRQRLMEAMAERQRGDGRNGTPTPPPVFSMTASRSTPTPPPMRSYEPTYMAQQNQASSTGGVRPSYESGFTVPPGYDPTQHPSPAPQAARSNPGYDRPIYEQNYAAGNTPTYNQGGYGMPTSNRRESAMFMGNMMSLNPQASKSRLREETRF